MDEPTDKNTTVVHSYTPNVPFAVCEGTKFIVIQPLSPKIMDRIKAELQARIYDCCHTLAQPSMQGKKWGEIKDYLTENLLRAIDVGVKAAMPSPTCTAEIDSLKTCPFCGGSAHYHPKNWGDGHVVRCSNDGCCNKVSLHMSGETKEEVFNRWNTRAQNSPISLEKCTLTFLNAIRAEYNEMPIKTQSGFSVREWNYGMRGAKAILDAVGVRYE